MASGIEKVLAGSRSIVASQEDDLPIIFLCSTRVIEASHTTPSAGGGRS